MRIFPRGTSKMYIKHEQIYLGKEFQISNVRNMIFLFPIESLFPGDVKRRGIENVYSPNFLLNQGIHVSVNLLSV